MWRRDERVTRLEGGRYSVPVTSQDDAGKLRTGAVAGRLRTGRREMAM